MMRCQENLVKTRFQTRFEEHDERSKWNEIFAQTLMDTGQVRKLKFVKRNKPIFIFLSYFALIVKVSWY